jgi:hypothetical protein
MNPAPVLTNVRNTYVPITAPSRLVDLAISQANMTGKLPSDNLRGFRNIIDKLPKRQVMAEEAEVLRQVDTGVDDKMMMEIDELLEQIENPIGKIPAVNVYNLRGAKRPIGISDLADVAFLQQSIYNDYSEKEQLIRLANHPSLVKTPNVEASAGAGSIIEIPEDMQADLKPYIIQPSGQNLDGIMKCIQNKVDAIDRITHMGSVRATGQQIASGIALQTEFQLLNARLSEKADYLENAEEHIWGLFANWQDREWDGSVDYPDTFDIRDWANDLQYLQMAKSSGIKSETFNKELDKQIAEAVIDDNETIKRINDEIDLTRTVRGQFQTTEVEGQRVNGEEEEETS